jgi:hypothetical protein
MPRRLLAATPLPAAAADPVISPPGVEFAAPTWNKVVMKRGLRLEKVQLGSSNRTKPRWFHSRSATSKMPSVCTTSPLTMKWPRPPAKEMPPAALTE